MNDQHSKTAEALKTLQYDSRWLEWRMLNEESLHAQSERFSESDDKNTEHYRYAAFRAALAGEGTISDELIEHYFALVNLDPDQAMARAALVDLIGSPRLTMEQFQGLRIVTIFADPQLTKIYARHELLRELKAADAVVDSLFDKVLSKGDSVVQRVLVDKRKLSTKQLEVLKERGANRAIRNIAKQLLQQRRA